MRAQLHGRTALPTDFRLAEIVAVTAGAGRMEPSTGKRISALTRVQEHRQCSGTQKLHPAPPARPHLQSTRQPTVWWGPEVGVLSDSFNCSRIAIFIPENRVGVSTHRAGVGGGLNLRSIVLFRIDHRLSTADRFDNAPKRKVRTLRAAGSVGVVWRGVQRAVFCGGVGYGVWPGNGVWCASGRWYGVCGGRGVVCVWVWGEITSHLSYIVYACYTSKHRRLEVPRSW